MPNSKKENLTIKRVSLVDQACENIKSIIISGELKEGDKLPSELELSVMFGVNRMTVRMALQKLSTIGIVETRVGEGSFVQDFSFIPYLNQVSGIYLSAAKLQEVRVLRKVIELESTKLCIQAATPEEMELLKERLDEYLHAVDFHRLGDLDAPEPLDALVERDLDFHYQICKNSHNTLFKDIFKLLRPLIKKHLSSLLIRRTKEWDAAGRPNEDIEPHAVLYDSIVNGDWHSCKKIYLELIDFQEPEGIEE